MNICEGRGFISLQYGEDVTVGELVYLWNKLLLPEVLDSFCEAVG